MNPRALLPVTLFLLAGPWLARHGRSDAYEGGRSRDFGARAVRNTSAAARLLGEFRTSLSDTIFVKTERYLHNGVGYELHLQEDFDSVTAASEAHDGGDPDHAACPGCQGGEGASSPRTTIPASRDDFRGWVGDLHRMSKPWQDGALAHEHTSPTELLPWFRLMTLVDARNVRGFAIGAWWLGSLDEGQALRFVNEGIAANPDAFQLHLVRAGLHYKRARAEAGPDPYHPRDKARPHFQAALADYRQAAEEALRARPGGLAVGAEHPDWAFSLDTDAMNACGMAALVERTYGDPAKALEMARRFIQVFPEHPSLLSILKDAPDARP